MSIDARDVVDAIGIETGSGRTVLTISDHWGWDDVPGHLEALQAKMNSYLAFVESGELVNVYPNAKGRTVVIDIVAMCEPVETAREFLVAAEKALAAAGVILRFRVLRAQSQSPDRKE